ncbi:serine hydrolase domain-containing protein [Halobacteriales archaeon Cl-PHB]
MALVLDVDHVSRVQDVFEMHLATGLHRGGQLAVYRDGTEVLNVAGGRTAPGGAETATATPHMLFSCAKPYAAACVHHLAERNRLDYDTPIREYWPGFAAPGSAKATVTVRQVLSHQAGLPRSALDDRPEDWDDWDAVVAAMEDADLAFTPGTDAAYHALTYGWLLGELVRRVSHTTIDDYARTHVFDPLGMDDTHIGKPAGTEVAHLEGYADPETCRSADDEFKDPTPAAVADLFNREDVQRAMVPASTAVGTARDMARFFAALANGGELDGTRVLERRTVERATTLQTEVETDDTLGLPRRYALGFERAGLPQDKYGTLSPKHVFGHAGFGSSVAWADPRAGLAMAYVTNGVRHEAEHRARSNAMADAVRTAFSQVSR